MDTSTRVTVYSFKQVDWGDSRPVMPIGKATRSTIVDDFHGEVLEGTGEEVVPSALDRHGLYRRVATGWGELADLDQLEQA